MSPSTNANRAPRREDAGEQTSQSTGPISDDLPSKEDEYLKQDEAEGEFRRSSHTKNPRIVDQANEGHDHSRHETCEQPLEPFCFRAGRKGQQDAGRDP